MNSPSGVDLWIFILALTWMDPLCPLLGVVVFHLQLDGEGGNIKGCEKDLSRM